MENGVLVVPDNPIVHIEGDGIGVDITPVMIEVVDAAVEKAYSGTNKLRGAKPSQVKRHSTTLVNGYLKRHSMQ